MLVHFSPVEIQDPATRLCGAPGYLTGYSKTCSPLLARMCLWPEVKLGKFVGFSYHPRTHETLETMGYFSMQKLSIYFLFKQQHSTSENETISYKSNLAAKLQGGVMYAGKFSLFIHSRHTYRLILLLL